MRVPPLLMLIGTLAASAAASTIDPIARPSPVLRTVGAGLAVAGVAVALAGVLAFRRRRTTVDPRRPERASALVAEGIYRWTRNPMYVGFLGISFGVVVALGSPMALAGPALLATYLDRVQIPVEERALRAAFGVSYEAYAEAVGRWVGRGGAERIAADEGGH